MKKLVVGATGTVGSLLVAELARRGIPTVAATRDPSRQTLPLGVAPVAFDYADEAKVRTALAGIDTMFVLAPAGMERQVERWRSLFFQATKAGVQNIVLMTAKGGAADTPHGQGELVLKASGLGWTILRPTFFMQNFSTYAAESIRRENAFYYPAGDGRTAFVDARDIAAVAAEVLSNPGNHAGKEYDLTGAEALSMENVARKLSRVLDRTIHYIDPGENEYRKSLEANGVSPALAEMFTCLYAVVVKSGWAAGTSESIARVLGRAPTSFDEFARDYAPVWAVAQR